MKLFPLIIIVIAACNHHTGPGGDDNPDANTVMCPNCPTFPPPGGNTPPCQGTGVDPDLVYPPDQVLLPPNMNVIDVHFMPGMNNTIFEIDFENAATDVRLETRCNAITNTRGSPTGGCDFKLDVNDWNFVSQQNKGGDPVKVTVRGAPEDVSCVSGSNTREVSFAEEDMRGGIYYWQSVTQGGVAGKTGGIFRKDFGDASPTPEPFLTPGNLNKCVGCHFLSHDGTRMMYGSDDADSDDEYGDLHGTLYDVANRVALASNLPAGFQTFSPDHVHFLASDGIGKSATTIMTEYDGATGGMPLTITLAGKRVTEPDWSHDGSVVYVTVPGQILTGISGYNRKDDSHFTNASLWAIPYDSGTNTFGTPSAIVTPGTVDENDYYPAISPDGGFLMFDRAVGTTLAQHDSFNNVSAKLFGLAVAGGSPVELTRANYKDGMTNSWPRWSPFVQMYKGKRILWVTFSSTRDYGLRVQNEAPPDGPLMNCYPPESPENPNGSHQMPFPPNCTQPQIWMAAVSLDDLQAGVDPSLPAFWLPFQDDAAHNHIAQWVDAVVGTTCTGGMQGAACSAAMPCCLGLACDPTSMTCQSVIQ